MTPPSGREVAYTGQTKCSNLLRQYIALQRAIRGVCEVDRLAEMMRAAA